MEIHDLLWENELNFTGLALAAVGAKDVYKEYLAISMKQNVQ